MDKKWVKKRPRHLTENSWIQWCGLFAPSHKPVDWQWKIKWIKTCSVLSENNSLNVFLTFPETQYIITQSLKIKANLRKNRYKWMGVYSGTLRIYSFGTNERQHTVTASLPHSATPYFPVTSKVVSRQQNGDQRIISEHVWDNPRWPRNVLKSCSDWGTDQHSADSNMNVTSLVTTIWVVRGNLSYMELNSTRKICTIVITIIVNMNWMFTMC